jgi:MFS family permease
VTDTTPAAAASRSGSPAPAAWRDVYLLSGMRGLSFAGDIVAATSITLHLQSAGAGSYAVMALLLAASVPAVLLAPVTGAVADRFDSRKLIVTVALLQGLVCLAMARWTAPAALIGLTVLLTAGLAFTQPVFAGLPGAMVSKDNVPRASSISQTSAMAGMVIAPGVAGFLSGHLGLSFPLVLDALTFVLVAFGGLAIRTRLHKRHATKSKPADAAAAEPAYRVMSDDFLRSLLVLSGAVMACASVINVLIVFYVRDTFGASEGVYGLVMSAWMAGLIPGAMLVRRVPRLNHEMVLIGSFLCIAAGILGTGLAPGVWWVVPCYVLGGLGNGAQATVTHILLNLRIPATHRGRAFAALGAVSNTGPAVGFFAGGMILHFVAPRYGFLAAGTLALVAVLLFAKGVRRSALPQAPAVPAVPAVPAPDAQPSEVS